MTTPNKTDALTTRGTSAMANVPSFIKQDDKRGTEQIGKNDIRPPALKLAQSMTPETKRSDAAYVEGLKEGDLFNSLTHEIYGEAGVEVIIVSSLGHRNMELRPLNEGGGVIDFNVPDGDKRTEFTTTVKDGKTIRVKPAAMTFYDFLLLVLHADGRREVMTVSLKGGQIKKAITLNTLLKTGNLPSFARRWLFKPVPEAKNGFNFMGWKIQPAGWPEEKDYNEASRIYDDIIGGGKQVHVADDAPDSPAASEEDVPF